MEHIYRFRLFAMSLILTLLSAVVLMAQTEPSDNEKIFTKWENVPFFIWQGEKHFEYNYTADNKAVVTNYGAPVYSLPKNLPVTVLARYYEGGDRFYYIMLPDGSLGYVPFYALDEVEISYSNKWKGTSVHYDGWVKGNKKVGNKIYAKYGWQSPEVTVKTVASVLVYGIGRMCHIAFWEPQFGSEFKSDKEWLEQPYRIGAKLHPLTIEQNAITSFRSRTSMVPCRANTIGPNLLFSADYAIGGADGVFSRGMQWQGMSFWMTLRHGPTTAITSSFIPTMPGKLFFMEELAGPLCPDTN